MADVEFSLRAAGVTLLAFVALLWLRHWRSGLSGPLGAMFCFAVASYLLSPVLDRSLELGLIEVPFFFGSFGCALFFWLMSRSVFDDGFRLRAWHGLLLVVMESLGAWHWHARNQPSDALVVPDAAELPLIAHHILSLGITLSALILAFAGKAADLVEARRRFRHVFVGVSGAYIIIVVAVEIYLRARPADPLLELVNVAAIFLLAFTFAVSMTRLTPAVAALVAGGGEARPASPPDPAEDSLLKSLAETMDRHSAYRQEGLTIARLAQQLGTQEYRLRRLINGRLGHRNFNEFINSHRIGEARQRLRDPEYARLSILTIAIDCGFASIGPFNRAFKEATGMTPKAYRAHHPLAAEGSPTSS